ncbi:hypothetical protein ACNF40_08615 [Cuniculiplasma sp. SKW4]|uniref:hypothetical protein n=1 Tax=Cuniculiplasma sp. SKW4 TaxID=3400171 RepID=UPI003FD6256D
MENIDKSTDGDFHLNTGPDSDAISKYYLLIGIGIIISFVPDIGGLGLFIDFIGFILLYIKRHAMGEFQHRLLNYDIIIFILSLFIITVSFVVALVTIITGVGPSSGTSNSGISTAVVNSILGDALLFAIALDLIPFGLCYLLMGYGIVKSVQRRNFSLLILLGIAISVVSVYMGVTSLNANAIVNSSSSGTNINTTNILTGSIYDGSLVLSFVRSIIMGLAFIYLWKVVKEGYGDVVNLSSMSSVEPY